MNSAMKLGLAGLCGLVVSSMMGSGVFSLPQNMALAAPANAVLVAWLITGIGMFFIAETFRILSDIKPHLTAGIFAYARDGFGKRTGFFIAWGYWLSNVFSNIAMAVIMMEALNYFFKGMFEGGNNLNSLILATVVIWSFMILIQKGIKTAALINLIGTVAKITPLVFFIIVALIMFKWDIFKTAISADFTFNAAGLKDMLFNVKETMVITLWCFIGIESAVILSGRAKHQKDVAKATLYGFLLCLVVYMLISLLPFGFLTRGEISSFANPSTAGVLEAAIGKTGAIIMNVGLIVSVLFAWLSWELISIEAPCAAAKAGLFPKIFAKENKNAAPTFSLLITTIGMQIALFVAFFSANAWDTLLNITAVMILPAYFVATFYLFQNSRKKHYDKAWNISRRKIAITGICGSIYALWLIYAADLKFLAMAVIFFAAGIPVFLIAKKENNF